jgi:hypothetical protein
MLQQQQQNSDNVGGGGEDDEEGEQHEVNKRDVYLVDNNIENMVEKDVYVENNVENEDQQRQMHNQYSGLYNSSLDIEKGLSSLNDEELISLSEERLTTFSDVLKSLNRSKRSSPSTAGSVCAPVRSANN